jgi:nitrogen regulatory protein P-II 1
MKQVKAYIHHARTNAVVQALTDAGYRNLALLNVQGSLSPLSDDERNYSAEGGGSLIGEARLELVCQDVEVDKVTAIICTKGRIGSQVSGWVYVSEIDQMLPIGGNP